MLLGDTYATEHKCRHFAVVIRETMREDVLAFVKKSRCLAGMIGGSTDSSVVEKELLYVMSVGCSVKGECKF